jgi:phosphoenolpyruvate-protein phosphotransferase (PTS system enzyme I)
LENSETADVRPVAPGHGEEPREIVFHGLPASGGIAIAPIFLFEREEIFVTERELEHDEIEAELELLMQAIALTDEEIRKIADYAHEALDDEVASIFDSQLMLLHDPELLRGLEQRIRTERRNADFLIHSELEKFKAMLLAAGDPAFHDRATDLDDVGQRLLRSMQHRRVDTSVDGPHIVVADLLTPSDTMLFSTRDVAGFASDLGGLTSHAAILSRSLNIPSVVGLHTITKNVRTGDMAIIDGQVGRIILHPRPETLARFRSKIERIRELESSLKELVRLPAETPDKHKVELSANAEFVNELDYVLAQGSSGIGLYRTEHLYIARGDFPSEQEQFAAYSEIAHIMYPAPVTIRTFDLGGDKFLSGDHVEANPFLGWRGIRVLLDKPDYLRQQLRAILRASVMQNVRLMFPMVSGVLELRKALVHLKEAKDELREQGIRFDEKLPVGIMIEVPSSVLMADELAKLVDFFSIGTNDLIQYLIAVDRNNDLISDLYQEFHPAVLRAIRHVIEVGHANNVRVAMCGEMAGNPVATPLLLGLGLDEFSMVPSVIPEVKKIIRGTTIEEARALAAEVMLKQTSHDTKNELKAYIARRFPELLATLMNHNPS